MSGSLPELNPPQISSVPTPDVEPLVHRVRTTEQNFRKYLDSIGNSKLRWLPLHHPVRTKNLEKIAGHLQNILARLELDDRAAGESRQLTLEALLDQLKQPERMAFDSAWEVADLLEVESLRLAPDPDLFMRLTNITAEPALAKRLGTYLPKPSLDALLASYTDGKFKEDHFRLEAHCALEHLLQSQISEYRVDRAKARLRGIYLITMAAFLGVLVLGMCYFYLAASQSASSTSPGNATHLLVLTLFSGAAGSVLSRAIQLGKQPLHAETNQPQAEPPLGIRALLSSWKVFFAQPVIGATAGLVLFLVLSAGWINVGGNQPLSAAGMALLGFVAGFSEPFFLGVLDKVAGKASASLR